MEMEETSSCQSTTAEIIKICKTKFNYLLKTASNLHSLHPSVVLCLYLLNI